MKFCSTVLTGALAFAALAVAAQASANCSIPKAPDKIPDGSKSTKEEMLSGMKVVRAYNDLVAKYTDCLKTEHDEAVAKIDPSLPADKQKEQREKLDQILQQKNDSAVDEDQTVTTRFNDQIKAFKAAHAS